MTANCHADTAFFRLNPLIQPAGNQGTAWWCPDGFTLDEFKQLVDLDIAAIKVAKVVLIKRLYDAWMAGRLKNQPIRANKALVCEISFANYPSTHLPMRLGWLFNARALIFGL